MAALTALVVVSMGVTVSVFAVHLHNHFTCGTTFPFVIRRGTIVGAYPNVALSQLLFALLLTALTTTKLIVGSETITHEFVFSGFYYTPPSVRISGSPDAILNVFQIMTLMCVLLCEGFFTFFRYTGTRALSQTLRLVKLSRYLQIYSVYVFLCFAMAFVAFFVAPLIWLFIAVLHIAMNTAFSYLFYESVRHAYVYVLENTGPNATEAIQEIKKQIWAIKVNSVSCVLSSVANALGLVFGVLLGNQLFLTIAIALNVLVFACCFSLNRSVFNGILCCKYCFGTDEDPDMNLLAMVGRKSSTMGSRLSVTSHRFSLGGRTFALPRLRSNSTSVASETEGSYSARTESEMSPRRNRPPMFSPASKSRSALDVRNIGMHRSSVEYSESNPDSPKHGRNSSVIFHGGEGGISPSYSGGNSIDIDIRNDRESSPIAGVHLKSTLDQIVPPRVKKRVSFEPLPPRRFGRSASDAVEERREHITMDHALQPPVPPILVGRHSAEAVLSEAPLQQLSPRSQVRRLPHHLRGKSAPVSIKTFSEEMKASHDIETTTLSVTITQQQQQPPEPSHSSSDSDGGHFAEKVLAMVVTDGNGSMMESPESNANRVTISRRSINGEEPDEPPAMERQHSRGHRRGRRQRRQNSDSQMDDEAVAQNRRRNRRRAGRHRRSKVLAPTKEFDDALRLIVAMQAMGLTVGIAPFEGNPSVG